MSDGGITLLGDWGKPVTKLVEVVSAGMGSLYRPRAIRKEAEAKAEARLVEAEADGKAKVVEAEASGRAELARLQAICEGNSDLYHRTRVRLLHRELQGQENIEAVIEQACEELPETVSDEAVDTTWRRKFFAEAENICDEDMQHLWGKILAGEIAQPGSYSVRTLDVLRNLSSKDAELFRLMCGLVFDGEWVFRPDENESLNDALKRYGLSYSALMQLADAGLMLENGSAVYMLERVSIDEPFICLCGTKSFVIRGGTMLQLQIPVLVLTTAGSELRHLIPPSPRDEYMVDFGRFCERRGLDVQIR